MHLAGRVAGHPAESDAWPCRRPPCASWLAGAAALNRGCGAGDGICVCDASGDTRSVDFCENSDAGGGTSGGQRAKAPARVATRKAAEAATIPARSRVCTSPDMRKVRGKAKGAGRCNPGGARGAAP